MFDIAYDAPANILRIHVRDFWSPEDVTRFAGAVALALRDARRMRSDFDIIVESFDFPVQANHVADLLAGIKDAGMTATSGRAPAGFPPRPGSTSPSRARRRRRTCARPGRQH